MNLINAKCFKTAKFKISSSESHKQSQRRLGGLGLWETSPLPSSRGSDAFARWHARPGPRGHLHATFLWNSFAVGCLPSKTEGAACLQMNPWFGWHLVPGHPLGHTESREVTRRRTSSQPSRDPFLYSTVSCAALILSPPSAWPHAFWESPQATGHSPLPGQCHSLPRCQPGLPFAWEREAI